MLRRRRMEGARGRLQAIDSPEELARLARRILTAASLEELGLARG